MKKVKVITDGACIGNPGPGGWAAILRYKDREQELSGSERSTTNNRMELTAAIRGLKALNEPCEVEVITDSQYLKKGVTEWIHKWKRNGWKSATKEPVKNKDLWEQLDQAAGPHQVRWLWTRGHASHADNNRADELATRAARKQPSSPAHAE
jgi:ribonuclease HI